MEQRDSTERPAHLESSLELKVREFLRGEPKELASEELSADEFLGLVEPVENTKENKGEHS